MITTLHGLSTMHCNLKTDIRIAAETGYEALELVEMKLFRFMDCGCHVKDLMPIFEKHNIKPVCINALKGVERIGTKEKAQLMEDAGRLCEAAEIMGCPTIQLVPFCELESKPWQDVLKLTAKNIAEIADIGSNHGVRFQLEPIAWAPIHSLRQSLQVIEEVGRDNVGMVIDFWHLTAGEETLPDDVTKLDKTIIYGVHFCDGIKHKKGTKWNEQKLRSFLPGQGELPIKEWVGAVKATGFSGVWSSELFSPEHWEWDLWEIARECRVLMEKYI